MRYISSLGYRVHVEDSLREGEVVVEKITFSKQEEIRYVRTIIEEHSGSIGILAKSSDYLNEFLNLKNIRKSVYVMSVNEAQGVEFDTVCMVGVREDMFKIQYENDLSEYMEEKRRINKDLLYVALTRAMSSLHIIGGCLLKDSIREGGFFDNKVRSL